jgi:hypothetical protein
MPDLIRHPAGNDGMPLMNAMISIGWKNFELTSYIKQTVISFPLQHTLPSALEIG